MHKLTITSVIAMQQVFQAWGITIREKVKTITSDNSTKVKVAVELLKLQPNQPCFTHSVMNGT